MKTLWTYYFSLLFNTSHILRLRTMKCQLNFIFFFFFFSFFLFFAELIELYLYLKEISLRHVWQWHRKYIKTFGFSQNHRMFISLYQKSWTQKKKKFSNCKEPKYIYIYIYISFFVKPAVQTDPCHFNKIVRQMYGHLCPNRTHYSCRRLVALTVSEISH